MRDDVPGGVMFDDPAGSAGGVDSDPRCGDDYRSPPPPLPTEPPPENALISPLWEARRKPGGGVFWRHRLTMEESEKPPAMLYPVVRFVGKNGQPGRIKLIRPELFVRTIYLKASLERTQAGPPSSRLALVPQEDLAGKPSSRRPDQGRVQGRVSSSVYAAAGSARPRLGTHRAQVAGRDHRLPERRPARLLCGGAGLRGNLARLLRGRARDLQLLGRQRPLAPARQGLPSRRSAAALPQRASRLERAVGVGLLPRGRRAGARGLPAAAAPLVGLGRPPPRAPPLEKPLPAQPNLPQLGAAAPVGAAAADAAAAAAAAGGAAAAVAAITDAAADPATAADAATAAAAARSGRPSACGRTTTAAIGGGGAPAVASAAVELRRGVIVAADSGGAAARRPCQALQVQLWSVRRPGNLPRQAGPATL